MINESHQPGPNGTLWGQGYRWLSGQGDGAWTYLFCFRRMLPHVKARPDLRTFCSAYAWSSTWHPAPQQCPRHSGLETDLRFRWLTHEHHFGHQLGHITTGYNYMLLTFGTLRLFNSDLWKKKLYIFFLSYSGALNWNQRKNHVGMLMFVMLCHYCQ